jgi:hypothetical protein
LNSANERIKRIKKSILLGWGPEVWHEALLDKAVAHGNHTLLEGPSVILYPEKLLTELVVRGDLNSNKRQNSFHLGVEEGD